MKTLTFTPPTRCLLSGALLLGGLPLAIHADDQELPFDVAEVFFELNHTDGDLGIHALIDGEAWKKLRIENVKGKKMLDIKVKSNLKQQGLTELFFESAEPTFDDLPPATFFSRFPAGEYEIEGKTLDNIELESETELTHLIPAPPVVEVNGEPMAEQCDDEEPGYDATEVDGEIIISWEEVTLSHPDLGAPRSSDEIELHNYQLVVETEIETESGEELDVVFSVLLPPEVTEMTVPPEFIDLNDEFKYEVLVRETSYNQTAVESCFVIDDQ